MDKQKLALAITKALGYTENGGKPDIKNLKAGKTGESKSIFQFTPATWKNYSQQVFGKDVPLTPDNETHVVSQKVSKWIDQLSQDGDTPDIISKKIASMWNAGVGEPDAYSGQFSDGSPSKGINKKYGVAFDVPGYANKVSKYTNEFMNESQNTNETTPKTMPQVETQIPPTPQSSTPQTSPTGGSMNPGEDIFNKVVSVLKGGGQAPQPKGITKGLIKS